jgi:hypothetical protein
MNKRRFEFTQICHLLFLREHECPPPITIHMPRTRSRLDKMEPNIDD